MNTEWNQTTIDLFLTILPKSKRVSDAVEDYNKQTGQSTSRRALYRAFAANNLQKPSCYLNQQTQEDLAVMARPYSMGGFGSRHKMIAENMSLLHGENYTEDDVRDALKFNSEQIYRREELKTSLRERHQLERTLAEVYTSFKTSLKTLKSVPEIKPANINEMMLDLEEAPQKRTLVVPVGDLHVGKFVSRTKKSPEFDVAKAKDRLQQVESQVSAACNLMTPDQMTIVFMGDMLEAILGNMRKGQMMSMDVHGLRQYTECRDMIVGFLASLSNLGVDIDVWFVAGNHDRMTEEKEYDSEQIMTYLLMESVAKTLEIYKSKNLIEVNVTCSIAEPYQSVVMSGVEAIFFHGHLSRVTTPDKVRSLCKIHGHTNLPKLVFQGHHHSYKAFSEEDWMFVTVPSLCGSDDYARLKLLKDSPPAILMFVVEDGQATQYGPINLT